ncbi:MAG: arginine--tRNA ligase [Chloroflexi bacterium]|nr:arginine--tRNA ligase [Chloroflexota bacterium]
MIKDELIALIEKAIKKAQRKGDLPKYESPPATVERPKQAAHGDYSTNIALQSARLARKPPMDIAPAIAKRLPRAEFVGQVDIAHPGFINFTLDAGWLARQVETIRAAGPRWGDVDIGEGRRVQVEYGSANPTGPLHVGFGRNVVIGDTLANVLAAAGYQVQREYYVNDSGTQVQIFGQSLYARYAQALGQEAEFPEDGYRGQYIVDWAQEIAAAEGDRYLQMEYEEAVQALADLGVEQKVLGSVRSDCERLSIHYDNWFSERSLYSGGTFDHVMSLLRQEDHLGLREGAVWFNATDLGGDKDEVLIRSTGEPGYFASDIAYHYDKFITRGFDWVIDIWGADHQGHVPRMKAMTQALDLDPERLTLIIYQLVTLKEEGVDIRLSKRAGTLVRLSEVLDDVGPDAVRFFLLTSAIDSQMDFDLTLAREQSQENPVYYVQYAHARIASILRHAAEQGWPSERHADGNVSLLTHPSELTLIRKMLELPEVVEMAARNLAPHHLPHYAQDLAATFHVFYRDCRVVSSDPADDELTKARLKLVEASKITLARVLGLIGVSAPEKM